MHRLAQNGTVYESPGIHFYSLSCVPWGPALKFLNNSCGRAVLCATQLAGAVNQAEVAAECYPQLHWDCL